MSYNIHDHFKKIDILDKGFVELIDGTVIDPLLKTVNAARVSYNKESSELSEKDIKLLNRLMTDKHKVFRHSYFSFRIKAPLFVFRQWWKHQIGSDWIEGNESGSIIIDDTSWNEQSLRYVEVSPEFYIPNEFRLQSKSNKQGSDGTINLIQTNILEDDDFDSHICLSSNPINFFEIQVNQSFTAYKILIENGIAKEMARMVLPVCTYSECIWTCSLETIMNFLELRLPNNAQSEIRDYALGIKSLMSPILNEFINSIGETK